MQNPEPNQPASGWKPTTSTVAGGGIGFLVGQFIVALCDQLFHKPLSPELAATIGPLCAAIVGYLFPDGGRK